MFRRKRRIDAVSDRQLRIRPARGEDADVFVQWLRSWIPAGGMLEFQVHNGELKSALITQSEPGKATRQPYIILLRNALFLIQQLDADVAQRIADDWEGGVERGTYPAFDEFGMPFPLLLRFADVVAMTQDRLAWEHVNDRTSARQLVDTLTSS